MMETLVFDIETIPFSEEFRYATDIHRRIYHAPSMRVACVYSVERQTYEFYTADEAPALVNRLQTAARLVSFNGKGFDLLVLARHYGFDLKGPSTSAQPHDDLLEKIRERAGYWVSLNDMVKANFGERKKVAGRAMVNLNLEELKESCRSDVDQTMRPWLAWQTMEMTIPPRRTRAGCHRGLDLDAGGGPGEHAPMECPWCGDVASLIFTELDPDDMDDLTEGQWANYTAGLWGTVYCTTCDEYFDYES